LTFAEAGEQVRVGDSSRSRVPTDNRDELAAERLHPIVANWRCRPTPAGRRPEIAAQSSRLMKGWRIRIQTPGHVAAVAAS
jgi:hypothetical protein